MNSDSSNSQQNDQTTDPTAQAATQPRVKTLVLIIEDENLITNMYSKKLSLDGYDCAIAMNGDEGLKLANEQLPDLILCDIMMPIKDGLTTLQELKANEKTQNIPVIMLSNLADQKYVEQALEKGAVSYLIKSNTMPSAVVSKVKEVLEASGKKSLLSNAA